jgi:hypothetical protein
MSRVPDKDVQEGEPAASAEAPTTAERAGKVVVDSRGHNVWRWARDVIESTSVLLKRLENKDLALEPTQKVPIVRGRESAQKPSVPHEKAAAKPTVGKRHPALQPDRGSKGGGFDPYNSR